VKRGRPDFWQVASVTRWQISTRALLVAVVVLGFLLAAAFGFEGMSGSTRGLPAPAGASHSQALGDGRFRFFPNSSPVTPGAHYRFSLYTHCGLDWPAAVDFDGSFWDPVEPAAVSGGSGNPPAGFANPIDRGIMTLTSPTRARYQSSEGIVVQFGRHPGPRVSSSCS
jgi:hypothetical protein